MKVKVWLSFWAGGFITGWLAGYQQFLVPIYFVLALLAICLLMLFLKWLWEE